MNKFALKTHFQFTKDPLSNSAEAFSISADLLCKETAVFNAGAAWVTTLIFQ